MVKNTALDLNNLLFEQLERVTDESLEGDALATEIARSRVVTGLASQVIQNANTVLAAARLKDQALDPDMRLPPMLEAGRDG